VQLVGAGKRYDLLQEPAMLLRSIMPFRRPQRREHWALRGVDLSIDPGETVGILGRNGAGKTTMLRMLAGVSRPTEGSITVRGRVAPLIGVGLGFHPEMTGRENVHVNAMLLGLTHAEVYERFDDIVAFAELSEFIDTPVKFYSSGMFMRLGFSVAVHTNPDVLLVDEVLAVGDIAFQLKCYDRMRFLQGTGTTILLVSHSVHAIRLLCPRAVLFRQGSLVMDGTSEEVIARHHELLSVDATADPAAGEDAGSGAELIERSVLDVDGRVVHHPRQTDILTYRARVRFNQDVDSPQVLFYVLTEDGSLAYEMKTAISRRHRTYRAGEVATVEIRFEARLGGGTYRLALTVTDADGRVPLVQDVGGVAIYLAPPLGSGGIADLRADITVDGSNLSEHDGLLLGGPVDRQAASGEVG
jgi:ABC-2 type transport system ATP-binding protein